MNMSKIIEQKLVEDEMYYWRAPSVGISVTRLNKPDEYIFAGERDVKNHLPVNPDTMFCIASCSKSMTATLIGCLVSEGILDFDRPVREYVPEMKLWDPVASEKYTLRDMLCHRTGFGAHDVIWPMKEDRKVMAERIQYIEPVGIFRDKVIYSNVMYGLIGYVAEAVTGKSWGRLMEEYLFMPIGMKRTNCSANAMEKDSNYAKPYFVKDGVITEVPIWNVDQCGPAASVNSTHRDMLKWLRFNCRGGVTEDGRRLLTEEVFKEIHTPQMDYVDECSEYGDYYWGHKYCMGWRSGEYKGRKYQKHSGKIEGYSSFQIYLPDEQIGMFVTVNMHSPTMGLTMSLVYEVLDNLLGETSEAWNKVFRPGGERAPLTAYKDCDADYTEGRLTREAEGVPTQLKPKDITGEYINPGYGKAVIMSDESGNLRLAYRDQTLPLVHWGRNEFFMDGVKADVMTLRVPVLFKMNEDGRVCKVEIGYESGAENIVFVREVLE